MFKKIKKMLGLMPMPLEEINQILEKAEQGDVNAQYNIGTIYDVGEGIPKDTAKAIGWYQKAAEQGHAKAQYMLGIMYESGDCLPYDAAKAVEWFKKAAKNGDQDALFHLNHIDQENTKNSKL
ncbi:tetratricopeptide repeat protein [Providencia sneebia]